MGNIPNKSTESTEAKPALKHTLALLKEQLWPCAQRDWPQAGLFCAAGGRVLNLCSCVVVCKIAPSPNCLMLL